VLGKKAEKRERSSRSELTEIITRLSCYGARFLGSATRTEGTERKKKQKQVSERQREKKGRERQLGIAALSCFALFNRRLNV